MYYDSHSDLQHPSAVKYRTSPAGSGIRYRSRANKKFNSFDEALTSGGDSHKRQQCHRYLKEAFCSLSYSNQPMAAAPHARLNDDLHDGDNKENNPRVAVKKQARLPADGTTALPVAHSPNARLGLDLTAHKQIGTPTARTDFGPAEKITSHVPPTAAKVTSVVHLHDVSRILCSRQTSGSTLREQISTRHDVTICCDSDSMYDANDRNSRDDNKLQRHVQQDSLTAAPFHSTVCYPLHSTMLLVDQQHVSIPTSPIRSTAPNQSRHSKRLSKLMMPGYKGDNYDSGMATSSYNDVTTSHSSSFLTLSVDDSSWASDEEESYDYDNDGESDSCSSTGTVIMANRVDTSSQLSQLTMVTPYRLTPYPVQGVTRTGHLRYCAATTEANHRDTRNPHSRYTHHPGHYQLTPVRRTEAFAMHDAVAVSSAAASAAGRPCATCTPFRYRPTISRSVALPDLRRISSRNREREVICCSEDEQHDGDAGWRVPASVRPQWRSLAAAGDNQQSVVIMSSARTRALMSRANRQYEQVLRSATPDVVANRAGVRLDKATPCRQKHELVSQHHHHPRDFCRPSTTIQPCGGLLSCFR